MLTSSSRYSYLAKVQQMHPQANLPQSAAQRQAAAQQKKDQPEEFSQYQKYQQVCPPITDRSYFVANFPNSSKSASNKWKNSKQRQQLQQQCQLQRLPVQNQRVKHPLYLQYGLKVSLQAALWIWTMTTTVKRQRTRDIGHRADKISMTPTAAMVILRLRIIAPSGEANRARLTARSRTEVTRIKKGNLMNRKEETMTCGE